MGIFRMREFLFVTLTSSWFATKGGLLLVSSFFLKEVFHLRFIGGIRSISRVVITHIHYDF